MALANKIAVADRLPLSDAESTPRAIAKAARFASAGLAYLAEEHGLRGETLRPLRVYALCRIGRLDDARRLAADAPRRSDEQKHFWQWMQNKYGVAP